MGRAGAAGADHRHRRHGTDRPVTRAAMVEISQRDFVRVLQAKGVPFWRIQLRHILQQAMLPVMTILGLRIGWISAARSRSNMSSPGRGSVRC
jgi:peptide/nickel transport system permease protein